jgi:hypothetical protein
MQRIRRCWISYPSSDIDESICWFIDVCRQGGIDERLQTDERSKVWTTWHCWERVIIHYSSVHLRLIISWRNKNYFHVSNHAWIQVKYEFSVIAKAIRERNEFIESILMNGKREVMKLTWDMDPIWWIVLMVCALFFESFTGQPTIIQSHHFFWT